tara:strand:- start:523 stop:1098 length:576 start_codon:yes stop_codon:yes gene_type:complete
MIKLKDILVKENIEILDDTDLTLERGKEYVLQANSPKYKRGLIVRLLEDGGYDVKYWYDSPDKIYPVEVIVDGESIKKDGKIVKLGFHPELKNEKFDSKAQQRYMFKMKPKVAKKLASKMTKKDYEELPDKIDEVLQYNQIPSSMMKDFLPTGAMTYTTPEEKKKALKLYKDLKDTINKFWKDHKINRKIK